MTDPIADISGDYRAFAAQQRDRLLARGIDITSYALSHLAFRVPEWDQDVQVPSEVGEDQPRVPTRSRPCPRSRPP